MDPFGSGNFIAFGGNSTTDQNDDNVRNNNNKTNKNSRDEFTVNRNNLPDAPKVTINTVSSERKVYRSSIYNHGDSAVNNDQDDDEEEPTEDEENNTDADEVDQDQDQQNIEDSACSDDNDDDEEDDEGEDDVQYDDNNKKNAPSTCNQPRPNQSFEYTEQFRDITCDVFRSQDGVTPVHTMFHLTQPFTLRGHCAIIGLSGHCTVQGYILRQRALIIPDLTSPATANNMCHVAVQPFSPKSKKTLTTELAKGWSSKTSGALAHLQHLTMGASFPEEAKEDLETLRKVEETFGKINWSWTRQVFDSWKQKFGRSSELTVVLVIAPPADFVNTTSNDQQTSSSSDFSRLPFFAPRLNPTPPLKLLDSILPEIVTSPKRKQQQQNSENNNLPPPSVLIAGAVNTGKSTTCRYLCNTLISLFGECLWLDLDLGQSEFAPPGGIGLFRVTQPLFTNNQYRGVETVLCHYLGTTSMRDPVGTARAIESICTRAQNEMMKIMSSSTNSKNSRESGARRKRGDDENNNQLDKNDFSSSSFPVPLVINTHGWVLSTGRRATLEVLQRVRPAHVVHLFTPSCRDKQWLLPSGGVISDPSCGLNAKVVDEAKFGTSTTTAISSMPEASTKKWSYHLHRYTHDREFQKDAADGRARMWTRYFWNSQAAHNNNKDTATSLLLSAVSSTSSSHNKIGSTSSKTTTAPTSPIIESENDQEEATNKKKQFINYMKREGEVVSLPFDKVRLIFSEEEQLPWQFRGRITSLPVSSLTQAIKAEILDSISGSLVALGIQHDETVSSGASSSASSLEIAQLCCEKYPPQIFGFGITMCPKDSDSAAATFSSVKVVLPVDVANVLKDQLESFQSSTSSSNGKRITVTIGWQQYDQKWNEDMARIALSGGGGTKGGK